MNGILQILRLNDVSIIVGIVFVGGFLWMAGHETPVTIHCKTGPKLFKERPFQ